MIKISIGEKVERFQFIKGELMHQKLFTRRFTLFLAISALLATSLSAQLTTGKIEGTVRDKDTGQPVSGVQVQVEGTRLGNISNADGYYFILSVPPGRRNVVFTYTGYQKTTVSNQLLLAGQTATVDCEISSTVVQLEGITIEGLGETLVPRDNTVSKQRLTSDQIDLTPATRLEDMLVQEAGVQMGGRDALERGLRIRGGRVGEEAMVVDGVMVRNFAAEPYRSSFRWGAYQIEDSHRGEDTTPLELSAESVEEVDIITGGFQAEYGNAQSGIVNVVTKEGTPHYQGSVRYITDEINPRTADWGYNQLQTSFGGPVPVIPDMYFHLSAELQGQDDRFRLHADEGFRGVNQDFVNRLNYAVRNDPELGIRDELPFSLEKFQTGRAFYAGQTGKDASLYTPPNPVRATANWSDRTLTAGKLTYSPIRNLKFIASHNWSRNQHAFPPGWNAEDNYFQTGNFYKGDPYFANRAWGDDEMVHVWMSFARRNKTHNGLLGFNWDLLHSANQNASLQFRYSHFRTQDINTASPETNWERETAFMSWSLHDIRFEIDTWPNHENPEAYPEVARNVFPDGDTGYKENVPYETPFVIDYYTAYYLNYRYLRERQHNYKLDLDYQLNRYNRAKLGIQYTNFSDFSYITDYHSASPRNPLDEFIRKPQMLGYYAQNRTDLGDFVFDYGLRYDLFVPMANWAITSRDLHGEDVNPQPKHAWSPRFDVAFPVTDKAQLRFSYGAFSQYPNFAHVYANSDDGTNLGEIDFSRTDAFEAGMSYLLGNDMLVDVVGYYRDVEGNVARKSYFTEYYRWYTEQYVRRTITGSTNRDHGNIKGLDLTLRKRFSNNYSFDLIYTLQFSRTTGSSFVTEGMEASLDPSTGETFIPPDELTPIDGDRTHQFTLRLNYLFPEDFKAGSLANKILKNFRAYSVLSLSSAEPMLDSWGRYQATSFDDRTVTRDALGRRIGGYNFFRGRWFTNLDLRFTKGFHLGAPRRMEFFVEIFNALNRKNHFPYPSNYRLESYSHITGGQPLVWADLAPTDPRRVRFNADFNADGILTVEEAALGQMAQTHMLQTMDKRLWGTAREFRTGLNFSF